MKRDQRVKKLMKSCDFIIENRIMRSILFDEHQRFNIQKSKIKLKDVSTNYQSRNTKATYLVGVRTRVNKTANLNNTKMLLYGRGKSFEMISTKSLSRTETTIIEEM